MGQILRYCRDHLLRYLGLAKLENDDEFGNRRRPTRNPSLAKFQRQTIRTR